MASFSATVSNDVLFVTSSWLWALEKPFLDSIRAGLSGDNPPVFFADALVAVLHAHRSDRDREPVQDTLRLMFEAWPLVSQDHIRLDAVLNYGRRLATIVRLLNAVWAVSRCPQPFRTPFVRAGGRLDQRPHQDCQKVAARQRQGCTTQSLGTLCNSASDTPADTPACRR